MAMNQISTFDTFLCVVAKCISHANQKNKRKSTISHRLTSVPLDAWKPAFISVPAAHDWTTGQGSTGEIPTLKRPSRAPERVLKSPFWQRKCWQGYKYLILQESGVNREKPNPCGFVTHVGKEVKEQAESKDRQPNTSRRGGHHCTPASTHCYDTSPWFTFSTIILKIIVEILTKLRVSMILKATSQRWIGLLVPASRYLCSLLLRCPRRPKHVSYWLV